jgi:hypothetical protein
MSISTESLVESFGAWANDNECERFWGIAKLGDGRVGLTFLPETDEYQALLVLSDGRTFIVLGPTVSGTTNLQQDVGAAADIPGDVFLRCMAWLLEIARASIGSNLFVTADKAASVASRIAHFTKEPIFEEEARILLAGIR